MKISYRILFSITFILVACQQPEQISKESQPTSVYKQMKQGENFSFTFKDTPCPSDYYDSATNTLVHTNVDGAGPFTISLELTDDELIQIFSKAIEVNFFDLPETLTPPEDSITIMQAPSSDYELSITNDNITHSVFWDAEITTEPLYKHAEEFKELFFLISNIIKSHVEYKQLPPDTAGCL